MRTRLWGQATQEQMMEIAGHKLRPDLTKAYLEFRMAHAFHVTPEGRAGGITAYGTATSARTLHNSYQSLLHQVVDLGHRVRAYDGSPDKNEIPRDYTLGSVVAVEFPQMPASGFNLRQSTENVPHIHGAAVVHKQLEKVPQMLGEHLGGRHKWAVSLEMKFPHAGSGFIIHHRSKGTKRQRDAMNELSPVTWGNTALNDLDMGYVVVEGAPDDLLKAYDGKSNRMKSMWGDLPATFLQGGLDGDNHFMGVGVVRYGAEHEARIGQILASDPDALDILAEDESVVVLKDYFTGLNEGMAKLISTFKK